MSRPTSSRLAGAGCLLTGAAVVMLAVGAAVLTLRTRSDVETAAVSSTRPAPTAQPPAPASAGADLPGGEVALYVEPRPDDFRTEYELDAANRQVETWEVYWGWINTYYRGNILARGWAAESRACLDRVTDPAARRALTGSLNDLGKLGAREWAKNAAIRRLTTDDVKAWGKRLDRARRVEDGTGAELLATLRTIHAEAEARCRRPGPS